MRAAVLAACTVILAACSAQGDSADSGSVGAQVGGEAEAPALVEAPEAGAAALPDLGSSVIKDATIDLQVEEGAFRDAVNEVTTIASRYGGYVLSSTIEADEAKRGSVTLRVPADRFEETVRDLRALGALNEESISGREVGQQFVDLEARLRNARAQQAVLLDLMGEAVTIPDTIRVQHELEGVQLEIEELSGRLRYLRDRTALGTIVVNIAEVGAPTALGMFARAWNTAVDLVLGFAYIVIVAAGVVVPAGVVALVGFVVWRRVRGRVHAARSA